MPHSVPARGSAVRALAAALLAGILFEIGSEIFVAAQHRTGLVLGMFFTYLIVKRLSPRYAVLAALLIGTALSGLMGLLDFSGFALEVATPVWTTPHFSLAATISIGIPLFVVEIGRASCRARVCPYG